VCNDVRVALVNRRTCLHVAAENLPAAAREGLDQDHAPLTVLVGRARAHGPAKTGRRRSAGDDAAPAVQAVERRKAGERERGRRNAAVAGCPSRNRTQAPCSPDVS